MVVVKVYHVERKSGLDPYKIFNVKHFVINYEKKSFIFKTIEDDENQIVQFERCEYEDSSYSISIKLYL